MSRFVGILVLATVACAQQQQQQQNPGQAQSVQSFVGNLINQVGVGMGSNKGANGQPAFLPNNNGQSVVPQVSNMNFNQQPWAQQQPNNFQFPTNFFPPGLNQFFGQPAAQQPATEAPATEATEPTTPQLPVQCILSSSFRAIPLFACSQTNGFAWDAQTKTCVPSTYCKNQWAGNMLQGFSTIQECQSTCNPGGTTSAPDTTVAGQTTAAQTTVVPPFGIPSGLFNFNFPNFNTQ